MTTMHLNTSTKTTMIARMVMVIISSSSNITNRMIMGMSRKTMTMGMITNTLYTTNANSSKITKTMEMNNMMAVKMMMMISTTTDINKFS